MEKRCCIYKTEKEYKIVTYSKSDIGLYLEDDPVFILPVSFDIERIKSAIFECLASSRKNIYTPKSDEEWRAWQKERLKKTKERTLSGLDKRSNYVCIILENNILTVIPGKYTPRRGFEPVEKDVVEIEYSIDKEMEITQKIVEMLKIDYRLI